MQTQASQQHNQLDRTAGLAIAVSCTAVVATLLTWSASTMGGANGNAASAALSPALAVHAGEGATDRTHGSSGNAAKPMCADHGVIAPTPEIETTGESSATTGCGVGSNLTGHTPPSNQSDERVDVATLLAWHAQAHNLIQYTYQTTLSGPSRTVATDDRPHQ